ncbi:hypothetical protein SAMN05444487_101391 [Marininema mesophilum]|uniref:Uncharacterized protein n=1 Tax=Marininema mesophilum TaxID=1048340 RepID=A0A1H2R6E5_9BACL|nr:hypothetical protein [Marininema mesophilum]SDW14931.1 hypothetical protein SAMN05444487_101391 [Marininema mesophilum]
MNKQSKSMETKLRRLIQRLVKEELDKRCGIKKAKLPPPGRKEQPAPPWAIFGSPQPDPKSTIASNKPIQGPFDRKPPPYVPHHIRKR